MFYFNQCKLLIIFCLLAFSLSGCGGDSNIKSKDTPIPERKAPVVNAGEDQIITEESTVTLSAVATDSDGEIVTYLWTQVSGGDVQLNKTDLAEVTFSAPDLASAQTLIFKVEVTDDDRLKHSDEVAVEVKPFSQAKPIVPPLKKYAPTVNAGPDQTVKETATVTLTSVATDTDGSIVTYKWTQTSGPSVPIDNNDKAEATFSAPDISKPETLEFEVLVTDSDGLTATDKVVVSLIPLILPTVNAGPDQTVKETATVTLTSFAADTDGSIVAYKWTQTSGPSVPIDNDDKAGATFSAPDISKPETLEFKVVVTDSDGLTATDRVVVSLIPLILPTVNAGPDQTVKETATVTLTSVATDTDGSIVAYKWTQTSGPSVPIDNNDKAEATFSAPNIISIPETLEFEILVTDSDGLTALDIVTVTVDSLPVFTNVNVIAGDGEITLSWELNDDKQLDFIRYFNIKNGEKINLKTINGIHESRHSISGLTNGLPYYFQLVVSTPESARHVTEGIPKSPSTGLLNDTGLFYDDAFLKALEEQVPNNLMPKYCSDTDGIGQQDCSHGRNAQLLAGNLSRSGVSNFNNGFDFNALDATGNLHVDYQKPWTCVRDNHTGLVWEVKTKDGGIHDKNHKYRWGGKTAKGNGLGAYYPDWNVLVNGSNADYFCGYNDWRVPTLKELHSVVDYSRNAPAFDMNLFQNTNSMPHWTSSPFAESDEHAWYIFLYEPVGNKDKRENNHYVRLVRGGKH